MPTARELLEQADALMRRNRAHVERAPVAEAIDADIPVLTETVDVDSAPAEMPSPPADNVAPIAPEQPRSVLALDDVPVLTDAVEEIEAPTIAEAPDDGEPSRWLDVDRGEASITGLPPDSVIFVPPPEPAFADALAPAAFEFDHPGNAHRDDDARSDEAPSAPAANEDAATGTPVGGAASDAPVEDANADAPIEITAPADFDAAPSVDDVDELALDELEAASAPSLEPPSAAAVVASARGLGAGHEPRDGVIIPADDDERWESLAEEIRMQVLQRIDIFTDTGLREQLTARLQPIVDRASADLVATINQHVGQLLRTYVAEAIEREIEKWRQGGV